jgi:hypothetical protein
MDLESYKVNFDNAAVHSGRACQADTKWRDIHHKDSPEEVDYQLSQTRKYLRSALMGSAVFQNSPYLEYYYKSRNDDGDEVNLPDLGKYVELLHNALPKERANSKRSIDYAASVGCPLPLKTALTSYGKPQDIVEQYRTDRVDRRMGNIKKFADGRRSSCDDDPVFVANPETKSDLGIALCLDAVVDRFKKYRAVKRMRSPKQKEAMIDKYFWGDASILNGCVEQLEDMALELETELLGEDTPKKDRRALHNFLLRKADPNKGTSRSQLVEHYAHSNRLGRKFDFEIPDPPKRAKKTTSQKR